VAVIDQVITSAYALYHGDCIEVMAGLPDASVHLTLYSPPFAGLYHYSSSDRDISNARNYEEFSEHYGYVLEQIARVTLPGRMSAVHCCDIPSGNRGCDDLVDFPGDIIRLHARLGFGYVARYHVWKEPFKVFGMRTLAKEARASEPLTEDSSRCANAANADYLLDFPQSRARIPFRSTHPDGLLEYAGERQAAQPMCSRSRGLDRGRISREPVLALGLAPVCVARFGMMCGFLVSCRFRRLGMGRTSGTFIRCSLT
jgi:hypothetical protein